MRRDHRGASPICIRLILVAGLLLAGVTVPRLAAQSSPLDQARNLVHSRTSPDRAKSLLQQAIAADPKNAEPHFLLGQILYAFGDFAKASEEAQKAIALDDHRSEYHQLLGNALSGMVDAAGMFKKMSLARQMKTEFERAVAEDPKSISARADLAEFYAGAPSIVGGGADKAVEQAKQISALDPVEGHYAMASIDLNQKKFGEAEQEYKTAIAANPKRAKSYTQPGVPLYSGEEGFRGAAAFPAGGRSGWRLSPRLLRCRPLRPAQRTESRRSRALLQKISQPMAGRR